MRKDRLLQFIAAFVLFVTGCTPSSQEARDGFTIAVVPKGTTHEYWKSIHAGVAAAERELNQRGAKVQTIWKGPLREDDRDQQIQVVESFISRRVSGIVLAPLDSQALASPVGTAVSAGIPVVVIDSGLNSDKPVSFIATDNFKSGQMAAEHLSGLLRGKGNVIMLRYAVGSAATEQREAGFLEAMKKWPDIQMVSSDQYAGPTRESAYQASQNLLNRHGRQVDGLFAPAQHITIALAMALRDLGRAGGKVKLVGFDAGTQPVADLVKGDLQALVVQDPFRMGYVGVMKLVEHLQGKPIETRIDTGVVLVTADNMNEPKIKALLAPPLE
jgi:ribose transport system substrate-binding protein